LTIHYRKLTREASRALVDCRQTLPGVVASKSGGSKRAQLRAIRVVGLCGALAACACSSDATSPGAGGAGGAAAAGANATSGSGGTPSAGGAGAGGAGAPSAGSGGSAAGSAGADTAGSAGSAGLSAGSGGVGGSTGGTGGTGGSTAGNGGSAGGTTDCAGHALSLSANGTGTASDAAKARVEVNLGSDLPIGSTTRTVELWAYMKSSDWTANDNTLFFYGTATRVADGFGLDFGNTSGGIGSIDPFTNAFFDNDNQPSGVTAATSQWVHFAMTWDGTSVLAYVNGALKSTKVSDSATQKVLKTGTSVLTIGGYPGESAYFADYIDEFRIWNVARSASQILASKDKTLVGNETGLVGYWQFNESSGTTAADSVTTAGHTKHAGTLMAATGNGVPTFVVPNPPTPVTCP
jgi:Concanavalin A-like lectin/glucanases superfamily